MPVLPLRVISYGDIKVVAPLSVIIYEEETMSAFFTAGLHFPHFGCIFAMAKGSAWRAPLFRSFACCRPLTPRKGLSRPCFGLQSGPNGLLKEPL